MPDFTDLTPAPPAVPVDARAVARLAGCEPSGRWDTAVAEAIGEARSLVQPRARWMELHCVDDILDASTPVAAIARRGPRWSFVATIGGALEARVREHFEHGRYLEGVLLDAGGSAAVEGLCSMVADACGAEDSHTATARFSPGYCRWPLDVQPRLLAPLRCDELGIRLQPSFLMQPLKSVSGIVVRAAPGELRVAPADCAECDARGCVRRARERNQPARVDDQKGAGFPNQRAGNQPEGADDQKGAGFPNQRAGNPMNERH